MDFFTQTETAEQKAALIAKLPWGTLVGYAFDKVGKAFSTAETSVEESLVATSLIYNLAFRSPHSSYNDFLRQNSVPVHAQRALDTIYNIKLLHKPERYVTDIGWVSEVHQNVSDLCYYTGTAKQEKAICTLMHHFLYTEKATCLRDLLNKEDSMLAASIAPLLGR